MNIYQLKALKNIAEAVSINDTDTLSRISSDDTVLWTASGSWTGSAGVTLGDLRTLATLWDCYAPKNPYSVGLLGHSWEMGYNKYHVDAEEGSSMKTAWVQGKTARASWDKHPVNNTSFICDGESTNTKGNK